jgi:hypothetical protein
MKIRAQNKLHHYWMYCVGKIERQYSGVDNWHGCTIGSEWWWGWVLKISSLHCSFLRLYVGEEIESRINCHVKYATCISLSVHFLWCYPARPTHIIWCEPWINTHNWFSWNVHRLSEDWKISRALWTSICWRDRGPQWLGPENQKSSNLKFPLGDEFSSGTNFPGTNFPCGQIFLWDIFSLGTNFPRERFIRDEFSGDEFSCNRRKGYFFSNHWLIVITFTR